MDRYFIAKQYNGQYYRDTDYYYVGHFLIISTGCATQLECCANGKELRFAQ